MVKADQDETNEWAEPPLPLEGKGASTRRGYFHQLSLLSIMISLVYFALLSWAYKQATESRGYLESMLVGVMVGIGLCLVGLWAATKLARFSLIGWIVFVIGYLTVTGSTTTFFAVPTLPILIGSIVYLIQRRRANNQDALLWVLAVASDRGMPLAPGVQAFSEQISGIFEIWASTLADLLRRGARLPDALDDLPRLVPRGSRLLIRMGWEAGRLSLGLREVVEGREKRQPVLRAVASRVAYLAWVCAVGFSIVGFIMYFIIPKFEAIFKDFGAELPDVTQLVIRGSHVLVDFSWVLVLLMLAALIYGMVILYGSRDLEFPIFDRLLARRHRSMIFRALAIVVDAGRPIAPAFEVLARHYPTTWVRKKLIAASSDVTLGTSWTEALAANGLLTEPESGVLRSAQRAGNLAWALRELADAGERRWAYRLQAWTQILFAATMLVIGSLLLVLAMAYFLPLVTLIMRLAE